MERVRYFDSIFRGFSANPLVALLGPRQSGKTTLARQYLQKHPNEGGKVQFFDLEDPTHLAQLQNPRLALEGLSGLVILDEIQRLPDLFPVLRVLVDRPDNAARFLILGSASRDLIRQSSETLAGRITYIDVHPFSLLETGFAEQEKLWVRGGFPKSFLAVDEVASREWRNGYIRTFLERDIPQLGITIPAERLRRFWMMLAHYHGQIFNASEIGRSLDAVDTTIRNYLDILAGTFMVRRLSPWFENVMKRQVKRPKIYFRDTGILHSLLGIADEAALRAHPKLGASWEGFALEEIIRAHRAYEEETYFWSVHGQVELDLLLIKDGKRIGFEIKYSEAPRVRDAHRALVETLKLDRLDFVCPVRGIGAVTDKIRVIGLEDLLTP